MDTKSRGTNYSLWTRLLAVIVALAGALVTVHGLLELPNFQVALDQPKYADSRAKDMVLEKVYGFAGQIAGYYRDEDYIRSGQSCASELDRYASNRQGTYNQTVTHVTESYNSWINTATNSSEVERLTAERDERLKRERELRDEDISAYRASVIAHQLSSYHRALEFLNEPGSYSFHAVRDGRPVLSNLSSSTDVDSHFASLPATASERLADGTQIYVGISEAKFAQLAAEFLTDRAKGVSGVYQTVGGLLAFLLGFGYTLYASGRRQNAPGVHLLAIDRPYLDVSLAVIGSAVFLCLVAITKLMSNTTHTGSQVTQVTVSLGVLLVTIATLLTLLAGSMISKRIKRGELIRHTLIYAVIAGVLRFVHDRVSQLVGAGPVAVRAVLLVAIYGAGLTVSVVISALARSGPLVAFGIALFVVVNAAALLFVLRKTSELQAVTAGAELIGNGNLSYRLPDHFQGPMLHLARSINSIATGLKAAVENEVKSERMKAELITNVSHDLKTPLTSLITYVDLLKREGLESENAPKYLDVLDRKSQRLKSLTEDLFEAAKAASGSITMNMERLDVGSLLRQGLGELADRMDASGLDFRVAVPAEKLSVLADGKLLWRVIENLLQNVFKYALPGSRVYVDASQHNGRVAITVKNISACALNIDPTELMERFKRGDESRHSEGSGLGLAIAKSLTELQGGEFKIDIDGDLFKATVTLPSRDGEW